MLPLSTKQLMQKSLAFKFSFSLSIALVIVVIVLGIVSSSVTCREHYIYYSCDQISSYYYTQCTNGTTYCCNTYFSYCGDYYCQTLDSFSYYRSKPCWGIFIAMWICSALCFFFAIFTFVLFRNLRQKALMQNIMHNHYNSSAQIRYFPPVVFVQQNPLQLNHSVASQPHQRLIQ